MFIQKICTFKVDEIDTSMAGHFSQTSVFLQKEMNEVIGLNLSDDLKTGNRLKERERETGKLVRLTFFSQSNTAPSFRPVNLFFVRQDLFSNRIISKHKIYSFKKHDFLTFEIQKQNTCKSNDHPIILGANRIV